MLGATRCLPVTRRSTHSFATTVHAGRASARKGGEGSAGNLLDDHVLDGLGVQDGGGDGARGEHHLLLRRYLEVQPDVQRRTVGRQH